MTTNADWKDMSISEMVESIEQLKADLGKIAGKVWISTFVNVWNQVEVSSGFNVLLVNSPYTETNKIQTIKMIRAWANIPGASVNGRIDLKEAKDLVENMILNKCDMTFMVNLPLKDAQEAMNEICENGAYYDLKILPNTTTPY